MQRILVPHCSHCQKRFFLVLRLYFRNCNLSLLLLVSFITDMKMSLFHISSSLFENCYQVSFHLLFCRQNPSELYIRIQTLQAPNDSYSVFLNPFNIYFECCDCQTSQRGNGAADRISWEILQHS